MRRPQRKSGLSEDPAHGKPLIDGLGSRADTVSLPRQRRDSPACVVLVLPRRGRDPQDGWRIGRGHRATERPLSPSPSLNAPIDLQVETKRNESNHDPRCAGNICQKKL